MQLFQVGHSLLRTGLPATLVVIGFCQMPALHATWLKWLAILGDSSCSIYLSHVFVLALLRNLLQRSGVSIDNATSGWLYMLFCLALSAVCGFLIYRFIEKLIAAKVATLHTRILALGTPLMVK